MGGACGGDHFRSVKQMGDVVDCSNIQCGRQQQRRLARPGRQFERRDEGTPLSFRSLQLEAMLLHAKVSAHRRTKSPTLFFRAFGKHHGPTIIDFGLAGWVENLSICKPTIYYNFFSHISSYHEPQNLPPRLSVCTPQVRARRGDVGEITQVQPGGLPERLEANARSQRPGLLGPLGQGLGAYPAAVRRRRRRHRARNGR